MVAGVEASPIPPVPVPATFALAVPSGEGEGIRSLLDSLSLDKEVVVVVVGSVLAGEDCRGWEGGAGDLRVDDAEGEVVEVEGMDKDGTVAEAVDTGLEEDAGALNTTGFVRGVACTLVINFALEQ